ncbi:MAG: Conserved hypothetical rane protein [Chthoniobacteraceae bacterium]|nr:Conserved hypothetical rane protein [Chthoniobacteraceae bacterium]
MSFLNFALLGGLAAFSIPIIIHLFHKSRFEVVKWGAMHLLESVIRVNQRRVRIEQIILMIVRAAIPVILALVMARPIWTGAQKLLGEAKSSTVVLLDNSYSMEAGRTGVSNFSLARDETTRIVSDLKRGSEVQVVLMGEGGSGLLDQPTYDTGRITQALGKLTAGYGRATVPSALRYAAGVFGQMHESARELVVLTDFQRVSFEATEDTLLGQSLEQLSKLPIPPNITFFDVGQEVKDNVAIESLDFSRLMVGVGQKVQIRANLRNYGEGNYKDLRVYFKVDGKERAVSQLPTLAPHEKGQLLFSYAFTTPGSHVVEVTADADPLKADNVFLASIPVRNKMPVLLVNGDPSSDPLKGETDFAEVALQPYTAGRVELADLISTKVIRADELDSKKLAESAVVVLANVRNLNEQQLRGLEEFVKNGGGLLAFTGNRIDQGWYNGALFKDGKGLLPMALGALAGDANSPSVSIVSQRFENPALELFNDSRNGTLSESAIRIWFKMKEPAASGGDVLTLARLANGDPFLAEKSFGEGHVISCATAIDSDWSNLPTRSTYVPLLQRLVVYLASTIYPSRNLDVGKPVIALFPPAEVGKKATLTNPEGITLDLPIVKKGERGVIEFGKTERPGLYTLAGPGGGPIHYVVNASRSESDLQKLSAKEIEDLATAHHITLVHNGTEYKALDHARRFGHEFWKPLLWALLALVFLEMILAQRFARPRRRRAPSMVSGVAKELHPS